ncbi:adenylosuccinate synthase [Bacteroidota bacterium]
MTKVDVLLGLQWGDEGKGKIVDFLAPNYQVITRFQGGPNAGHTLEFEGIKHVLHQIPSGIFRENIINIIGNGVVLDPVILKKEVEALNALNVDATSRLYVANKVHLILPTHRLLDEAYEEAKGKSKIGSTLKGIGPTYQDKVARLGVRVGDIEGNNFLNSYECLRDKHLEILDSMQFEYDLVPIEKEFFEAIEFMKDLKIIDSAYMINDQLSAGNKILAEGAQGSMLDVDFGSYPFVTSSNTTAAGASTGLGVAPSNIGEVFGIFKAYCTRVGSGPFPTELLDDTGEELRKVGREYGATTGRPRRCGWLDVPALKYTIMLNGVTRMFMTKADVLDHFETIRVGEQYQMNGNVSNRLPYDLNNTDVKPLFRDIKGWNSEIRGISNYDSLPGELKDYVNYLESQFGVPIGIISTGADRKDTVLREL